MRAHDLGRHICLAAQPRTVNGSPDTLIVRGVAATLETTGALADAIVKAVSGKTTAAAIKSAIDGAAKRFGAGKLAKPIERELLHGALLGALDAFYESETDRVVPGESFAAARGSILLGFTDARFAARPLGEAIKAFLSKKAVTRDVFDAMEKAAQRRAFTVANAANEAMVRTVKQELLRQLAVGADLADFGKHAAKRFESAGWTPANSSHVETVFRTNVLGAYNGGRIRQMTQPEVLDARPFWESLPVGDGPPRQRKTHRNFVLRAADPFWQKAAPPYGYNCFVPGTAVEGRFIGASRARYVGQTVELTTAEGRRLTVTANHPILTPQGFAPAHALRDGDELVCYRAKPGIQSLRRRAEGHEDEAPSAVEHVFGALAQTGMSRRTRVRPEDFHGEARRFDGDVEVVGSFRMLHDHLRAEAQAEHTGNLALKASDPLTAGASRYRLPSLRLLAHQLPAARLPGAGELALRAARRFDDAPLHELRIGSAARLDAVLSKNPIDDLPADVVLVRELLARSAGAIAIDHLARIRKFDGVHIVYDLETEPGWLVAEGIVTSNCRCRLRSLSIRQGAGRVQEGTSIHGLPDEGFASGISTMFEGGDLPSTEPANDPPPKGEPANDATRAERGEPGEAVGYDALGNPIDAFGNRTEGGDDEPRARPKAKPRKPPAPSAAPAKPLPDASAIERKQKQEDERREKAEQKRKEKADKAKKDAQREVDDLKKKIAEVQDNLDKLPTPEPKPPEEKNPFATPPPPREAAKAMTREDAIAGYKDANVFGIRTIGTTANVHIKGENAHRVRHEVYKALDDVGFAKFFNSDQRGGTYGTRRMGGLVLTEDVADLAEGARDEPLLKIRKGANGVNHIDKHLIKINCNPRIVSTSKKGASIDSVWSVSTKQQSSDEMIKATAIHEFGHSIAMDDQCPKAEFRAVDKLIKKEFKAKGATMSKYASTNHDELFAESFAAYHTEREWLRTKKPSVFKMVEDVLKLKGML